jgi:hypothetical protein
MSALEGLSKLVLVGNALESLELDFGRWTVWSVLGVPNLADSVSLSKLLISFCCGKNKRLLLIN